MNTVADNNTSTPDATAENTGAENTASNPEAAVEETPLTLEQKIEKAQDELQANYDAVGEAFGVVSDTYKGRIEELENENRDLREAATKSLGEQVIAMETQASTAISAAASKDQQIAALQEKLNTVTSEKSVVEQEWLKADDENKQLKAELAKLKPAAEEQTATSSV